MKEEDDLSVPESPADGGIEIEWDELSPEAPTARHNNLAVTMPADDDVSPDDRPTAVPPASYGSYASRLMCTALTTDEAKRALSTASLPKLGDVALSDHAAPFMDAKEASIPASAEGDAGRSPVDELFDGMDADANTPVNPNDAIGVPTRPVSASSSSQGDLALDFTELNAGARPDDKPACPDIAAPCTSLDLPDVQSDDGTALGLVALASPPSKKNEDQALIDLHDRYAVGDFSGALAVAETILEKDPDNANVARYAESCRDILTQMYTARLGSTHVVPKVVLASDRIRWLTLDHRAGFLLSCIDGISTVEEILDVSGMPALDSLRILCDMLQQEIIQVSARRSP